MLHFFYYLRQDFAEANDNLAKKEIMTSKFIKCLWLLKTIKNGPITYEEINERWENSSLNYSGDIMPKRSFHNHLTAIQEMFDIVVTCDRKDGYRYSVEMSTTQDKETVNLLSNLFLKLPGSTNELLRKKICDMDLSVIYPQLFDKIVDSIEYHSVVSLRLSRPGFDEMYRKAFPETSPNNHTLKRYRIDYFAPIGLVKLNNHWYLIGRNKNQLIHIYDANKIIELDFIGTNVEFNDEDFNVEEFTLNYKSDLDKTFEKCFNDDYDEDDEASFIMDLNSIHADMDFQNKLYEL